MAESRCNDMVAISPAWLSPLRCGRPDTTISTDGETAHEERVELCCAASTSSRKLTGIANGLHFIHVEVVNDAVKAGVKVVKEVNHLKGSASTGYLGEANNVTEVDGDTVK